jgi:hypothetical protein
VRTTLTLDEDIARRLQAEVRRSGKPFKTVVNEQLRQAFAHKVASKAESPFVVNPFNLGGPVEGRSFDNIEALIEEVEGPWHR